jgi:hypothetical protein
MYVNTIEATRKTTVPQKIDDFGANSQGQLAGLKTCRRSLAQAGKRGGGGENWRQKGDFLRRSSFASYLYSPFHMTSAEVM